MKYIEPTERVIIESPFSASDEAGLTRNLRYLRACMRDCFRRGEAPYASHALYTQEGVLDDEDPDERLMGIQGGFLWAEGIMKRVFYMDLGMSRGMEYGLVDAKKRGQDIEQRHLPGWEG